MAMGALSFFLPLRHFSCPVIRYSHSSCSSSRTHISKPTSWHCVNLKPTRGRGKTVAFGGRNSSEPNETQFLDEDGVVEDMDGYLNYLSLEYDSVWDTKPSWCQPWTITLTGVAAIACSWTVLHSVVVTMIVTLLICTWWYVFLYSYPKVCQGLKLLMLIFSLHYFGC
uniref:DUF6737 domain-containing protein n=1 Tax=Rhizophora mucronata TaxID=61149 RepID=A0A2P2JW36_RHIMU